MLAVEMNAQLPCIEPISNHKGEQIEHSMNRNSRFVRNMVERHASSTADAYSRWEGFSILWFLIFNDHYIASAEVTV